MNKPLADGARVQVNIAGELFAATVTNGPLFDPKGNGCGYARVWDGSATNGYLLDRRVQNDGEIVASADCQPVYGQLSSRGPFKGGQVMCRWRLARPIRWLRDP